MKVLLITVVLGTLTYAGTLQQLPALPRGATAKALQLDSAGNIYVAGSLPAAKQSASNNTDAFVAKLSGDGSAVVFFTVLAGSGNEACTALAIGVDGSIYVTGSTNSVDFPATPGALQTTYGLNNASAAETQAFAVKLNSTGVVKYATYLGGNVVTAGLSLAVDAAGDAFILGTGLPTGVPVISGGDATKLGGFVIELNPAASKVVTDFAGLGGQYIALDAQRNVYLAGASTNTPQFTPGAFQTSEVIGLCGGTEYFGELCPNAYVAKVNPAGPALVYLTGLNGALGATPSGIAVDADGNVVIAGSTRSADFPVTASSFQTTYTPVRLPSVNAYGPSPINAPLPTGFASKLNSSGSGLLWSTFFGGTVTDSITAMSVHADGIYLAGQANSSDLPGLSQTPAGCRPSNIQALRFVARLEPDGSGVSQVQLLYGASVYSYGVSSRLPETTVAPLAVASPASGTAIVLDATGAITKVDLFANTRLACVTDPADNVQLTSVAPGQDLTIFGTMLALVEVQPGAPISTGRSDVAVTFDSASATVLYGYGDQVSVQVPVRIGASGAVQMMLTNTDIAASVPATLDLFVVAQQPSVFLSANALAGDLSFCYTNDAGTGFAGTSTPLAHVLNADGSVNTGGNPAAPGSTVTIFLNGVPNSPSITGQVSEIATTFTPLTAGWTGGALPVRFTIPPAIKGENAATVALQVNGAATREPSVSVCVQLPPNP